MDFNQLNKLIVQKTDPLAAKLGTDLFLLHEEYMSSSEVGVLSTSETSEASNSMLRVDNGYVVIDFVATDDADTLLAKLQELGLKEGSVYGRYVSGMFPIEAIAQAADLKSLKFARAAIATTNVGLVTSEADIAMRADIARSTFDVDGRRVTVGVLSDSYDNLGGAARDVATGDLPGVGNPLGNTTQVNVLKDLPGGGSDEGRAMLQLVHDVAPGADLAFHTAFGGQADFANGIIELAATGSDVIVDDVIYFAEPMFQDGIIAQAVDKVVADGAAYFSSAGNGARNSYESAFTPSGIGSTVFGEFHDFDPGVGVDFLQSITVPVGAEFLVSFQWDSPFFSVSGGAGSPNDLDIFLVDESGRNILTGSAFNNIGNDPVEAFRFVNDGSFGTDQFNLAISNFAGPNPDLLKYVLFRNTTINEYATNSSTTFGHSNAAGAEAVGAAFYQRTPEYGVNPAVINRFSSAGGTPILFDTNGDRLPVPEIRRKPEITAPDGTNTTFFPPFPGQDIEGDGFPNFFGTSAAAPHAAAVAALMLDAIPSATPAEIYEALEKTALDMDDPFTSGFDVGFDFKTGFGLIQADAAIEALIKDKAIVGTDNSESLFGTVGDDIIFGKGGNDQIFGNDGMNTLYGGTGDDTMYGGSQADDMDGGSGNDLMYAGEGENIVFGNTGDDTMYGGSQADDMDGGSGNDLIYAGEGKNIVFGNTGDDTMYGGSQADDMDGGSGNDLMYAGEGENIVLGGTGDDTMYGGSQADTMYGGSGNDAIFAAEGDNIVFGGAGDDTIYTGSGNDKIDGGLGNDNIWLGGGDDIVVLELGKGIDTINNFQLGQTTFDISGNTDDLSIVDGVKGAEISQFGELLAVVSWNSASTLIDNIDTVFA